MISYFFYILRELYKNRKMDLMKFKMKLCLHKKTFLSSLESVKSSLIDHILFSEKKQTTNLLLLLTKMTESLFDKG